MPRFFMSAAAAALGLSIISGCGSDKPAAPVSQADQPKPTIAPAAAPKPLSTLILPSANAPIPYGDSRFVTKWAILGPCAFADNDFDGDQQQAAIDKPFIANEASLDPAQPAPVGAKWQEKDFAGGAELGRIDLQTVCGDIDHAAAYAVAYINSPEELTNVKLLTGSDDYIRVWINGKLVHTYNTERRAGQADQNAATVSLKKGVNQIVVKCVDVVLDWNFYLRFATADGKSIAVKAE